MASRAWDGRNIEDLPAELLATLVRKLPRTVLNKVANMLQVTCSPSGSWEMVAEKLGFNDNSRLEELLHRAQIRHEYPGMLMLHEWGRSEGSTAFVLLHVLRESEREDIVHVLVEALYGEFGKTVSRSGFVVMPGSVCETLVGKLTRRQIGKQQSIFFPEKRLHAYSRVRACMRTVSMTVTAVSLGTD
ncbi:hypothetical protein BaRGS_00030186 [Batillaria attramentaria]|uniref:Death domain-containing protein n=1 Tax=Batillaria attramentaria TaxID=370345 RepID=A0ABD0JUD3_9CAEN